MDLNGPWFIERDTKRTVLFRGVNLGGGTKLPKGIPSHQDRGFWEDYDTKVDFVGRPFPLHEADDHLQRLADWGFNLIRLIVTWEAIEHKGPGLYDEEYLDYITELLKKCEQYDLKVFIDPHQDAWSRQCGGSGHPGWTHALVGLNPRHFSVTNAAIVHNTYPIKDGFPKMIWNTNYQKLAAATMFTLFFAGKTYAPKCIVNGVHVQDYLQTHYFNAFRELAKRIHKEELEDSVVIGYDTMNEPGKGYIGLKDISKSSDSDIDFKMGLMPTPYEGMQLGSGIATNVEEWDFIWSGPKRRGKVLVDPKGTQAWMSASEVLEACNRFGWQRSEEWSAGCIWEMHGVWSNKSSPSLLSPHYFASDPITGESTDYHDFWIDFLLRFTKAIREFHTDALIFVQPAVLEPPPLIPRSLDRLVYAPHWYDGLTLVKKKWCSYNFDFINLSRGKYGTGPLRYVRAMRVGEKAIRQCFVDQLKTIREEGLQQIGNYPCLLGEIGIPYDMQPAKSNSLQWLWAWVSAWFVQPAIAIRSMNITDSPDSPQNKAMDANMHATETNLLNYAIWHYMPDNDSYWGDLWNGEDLSVWQTFSAINHRAPSVSDPKVLDATWVDQYLDANSSSSTLQETPTLTGTVADPQNARDIASLHRPHARKIAGTPLSIEYISPTFRQRASYHLRYTHHTANGPTEIFIPSCFFPIDNTEVTVSNGRSEVEEVSEKHWLLRWWAEPTTTDGEVLDIQIRVVELPKKN
ncbi:hypothetical protein EC973_003512 [Apophysomyces ossiformis]|uniref:Uncharacterized protein n=1 Tax=Apophysomyces ossiformis TaxID=679940 RepID=A0A8H7BFL8_9FUNG|nr:hypothetical protein EC973_003512 [Apophysomyces ossiformis]